MKTLDNKKLMRLVERAKYSLHEKGPIELRRVGCIDERAIDFPAGRMAGGDIGQEIVILAAANSIDRQLDPLVVFNLLCKFVNGEKNLHRHENCGYQTKLLEHPERFGVSREEAEITVRRFLKSKAERPVLEGTHNGRALLIVRSKLFGLHSSHPDEEDRVFVHHQTLIDARQEELAKLLVDKGIVQLPKDMSRDDFAELLKRIVEDHLFTTKQLLVPDIPTRHVEIDDRGKVGIIAI